MGVEYTHYEYIFAFLLALPLALFAITEGEAFFSLYEERQKYSIYYFIKTIQQDVYQWLRETFNVVIRTSALLLSWIIALLIVLIIYIITGYWIAEIVLGLKRQIKKLQKNTKDNDDT